MCKTIYILYEPLIQMYKNIFNMYKNDILKYKSHIYFQRRLQYLQYNFHNNNNMKTVIRKTVIIASAFLTFTSSDVIAQEKIEQNELSRVKANHMLSDVWMRDPYIFIGPDQNYYLTYTNGKMEMPVWKSTNLMDWQKISEAYSMSQLPFADDIQEVRNDLNKSNKVYYDGKLIDRLKNKDEKMKLWAPEIYFINNKWYAVHTTNCRISVILSSNDVKFQKFELPFDDKFGLHHDPSIFIDDDGSKWLIDKCAEIRKFNNEMNDFEGEAIKLNPANRKMGHEGCQIIKFGNKYVWFGTAWSKDELRKGTYNLYYATADKIEGPYSDRKFAGRCLGHGTVFKDKEGQWWCTAFLNGIYKSPTEVNKGVDPNIAISMNKQGLTLVPLSIEMIDGDVSVKALDPEYANPGKEENQKFQ